jgi:serine/threonine-protein phosphatase 2A regulatory subunit B
MVSSTKCSPFPSLNKWSLSSLNPELITDKTIKLWKVYEKSIKLVAENNLNDGNGILGRSPIMASITSPIMSSLTNFNGTGVPHFTRQNLRLPRMTHHETIVTAHPRRSYQNAHAYHINSISVNSDAETFISADDLRINLWNLNIPDQSFSTLSICSWLIIDIVDIKPVNMEELTEVITAAEFHPVHCNYFAYSSSKGTIKLADMRESALCDKHAKRTFPL